MAENENGTQMDTSEKMNTDDGPQQDVDGSPEVQECTAEGVIRKKVQMGKKCDILPSEFAKLRQKEKSNCKTSRTNNFSALSAGAQMLLPNKPLIRTKLPERKPPQRSEDVAKERTKVYTRESSDEEEEYKSSRSERKSASKTKYSEPDHYCKVCDVLINSEQTYVSHVQGKKHQKKLASLTGLPPMNAFQDEYEHSMNQRAKIEEALPQYREVKSGALSRVQNKLDKLENACVGLSHVTEIWRVNLVSDAIYVCNLCYTVCQPTTIVSHVIGYKHRLNYMKIMTPEEYSEVKELSIKKSELTAILERRAEKLESRYGRGMIVIEQELEDRPGGGGSRSDTRPQDNHPALRLENICSLPAVTRLDMLAELKLIKPNEIWNIAQFQKMFDSMLKLRQQVMRFKGVDELDYDYRDNDYRQSFQEITSRRDIANDIPPFPYGQQAGTRNPSSGSQPIPYSQHPSMATRNPSSGSQPFPYSQHTGMGMRNSPSDSQSFPYNQHAAGMRDPSSDSMFYNNSARMPQPTEHPMLGNRNTRMADDSSAMYNRFSSTSFEGGYGPSNRNPMPPSNYMAPGSGIRNPNPANAPQQPGSMIQYPRVQNFPHFRSILF